MSPAVNLLNDTPRGHTWIQVVLDLPAEDFELEHVRALRRDLTRHLGLEPAELRLVGVSRWKPIIDLQLPESQGLALVQQFETAPASLAQVVQGPPIELIRHDRRAVERFSIVHAEVDLWSSWTRLLESFDEQALRQFLSTAGRILWSGLKVALMVVAALAAALVASFYTGLKAIFGWIGGAAGRAGAPVSGWPENISRSAKDVSAHAAPWVARLAEILRRLGEGGARRLTEIATLTARSLVDGTQRLEEDIWSQQAKFSLSRIGGLTPHAADFRAVAVPLVETAVAASMLLSLWLMVSFVEFLWSLLSGMFGSFQAQKREWAEIGYRPQDEPWIKDKNDILFMAILSLVGFAVFMGFLLI